MQVGHKSAFHFLKRLVEAMISASNCSVVGLNLRGNGISIEGGEFLGRLLDFKENSSQTLQFLTLEWNRIGMNFLGNEIIRVSVSFHYFQQLNREFAISLSRLLETLH